MPPSISEKIDTAEVRKVSFWVSQVFILAATVLGVYLAASTGFKQAVAYEKLMSDKSNYYLRQSLKEEVADNIRLVKDYSARLSTGGIPARKAVLRPDTFVWDSMKFSPATLETPSELLSACRKFYRDVIDINAKVIDNTYGVENAQKRLLELTDTMEKEIIPRFEANTAELKKQLTANGIEV